MATYPAGIYAPREKENLNGVLKYLLGQTAKSASGRPILLLSSWKLPAQSVLRLIIPMTLVHQEEDGPMSMLPALWEALFPLALPRDRLSLAEPEEPWLRTMPYSGIIPANIWASGRRGQVASYMFQKMTLSQILLPMF